MTARDLVALVHLAGFTTGIILYAMLGVMTRRRLAYVVALAERHAADRLPLAAALLGIVWNAGAMFVFAVRDFDIEYPEMWVAAVAYTALGFLPAVVVHATPAHSRPTQRRWFVGIAYTTSAVAGILHFVDAARGETPSSSGLFLLTVTYAALLAFLAATERRRPGFQRSFTAVALAAFAVSALHLSRHAGVADHDPWMIELAGHHASLPLVLAILYQNYRFAFADLFLKRALSLLVLVGVVSLLYATLAAPLIDPHLVANHRPNDPSSHLFSTGAVLGLWIMVAVCFPAIRRWVDRFVDRVVLRRSDYHEFRVDLARRLVFARDADEVLDLTAARLGHALGASSATWRATAATTAVGHPTIAIDARRTSASIIIPTAIDPSFEITVAELTEGRALLSDDLMLIDAVAASVGRTIDGIRVEIERDARDERDRELRRLATEAELRALRAQLNPHFLFNALNTLGHLMQSAPDRALATLYQLTGLLRAVLRKTNGRFVPLRDELDIVESYLAIERERFQERLNVVVDVPRDVWRAHIPPLVLQPLVENAVKHGIGPRRHGGTVTITAARDGAFGGDDGFLRLSVADDGVGISPSPHDQARSFDSDGTSHPGVGLENISQRLNHYFGIAAALSVRSTPGGGTTVELVIPWIASESPVLAHTA